MEARATVARPSTAGAPRQGAARPAEQGELASYAIEFLELLTGGARSIEFERPLVAARAGGAGPDVLARLEHAKALALRIRATQQERRRREQELSALFETVADLAGLKDLDDVLEAIVSRVRQLLGSDVSYLSLNDDEVGDTYMRVTSGITAAAFKNVRLPFGAGLGGLVAQTATPYWTDDYFRDERFHHTTGIDGAVRSEELTAILGVPLLLGRRVIGVLYAANRSPRAFSRDDVSLLVSLAAHAAVALDNARLLAETQAALTDLRATSAALESIVEAAERAAAAHDRLAAVVLRGGNVHEVVHDLREVLGGEIFLLDPSGSTIASTAPSERLRSDDREVVRSVLSRHDTHLRGGVCACVVGGGDSPSGVLLHRSGEVDDVTRRIVERAAVVTALLLLQRRSVAEAESRLRGDLLGELLAEGDKDLDSLRERASRLGVDLDRGHAVVVAQVDQPAGRAGSERSRALLAAEHLASLHQGLAHASRSRLVLVLPERDPRQAARDVGEQLAAAVGSPVTTGAAGPASGPGRFAPAYQEATRCLDALLALGRQGDAACPADLGFVGLLIGGDRDVDGFVRSRLGPVLDYDRRRGTELAATLSAFFAQGQHLGRTAAQLTVHPNTVTQRLERVGRLLGEGWSEPEQQLEVQLALRLAHLSRR